MSTKSTVKWNSKNKQYYISKGYDFTAYKDSFEVYISDLSPASKSLVEVQCDFCGEIVVKAYQTYNKQHHSKYGDCCAKCQPIKNRLVCLDKYGVDNGSKTQEAIDKIKITCLEKYGVENPAQTTSAREKISTALKNQSVETKEKRKQTNLARYGVEYVMQNNDIQKKCQQSFYEHYNTLNRYEIQEIVDKIKTTNNKKYGCDWYQQTQESKDRVKATNLEKYGYEHTLQVPEIRAKGMETLLDNNLVPTSKQQKELCNVLHNVYNNCELNKPCGNNFLDCVVKVNNVLIDVEYDGKILASRLSER